MQGKMKKRRQIKKLPKILLAAAALAMAIPVAALGSQTEAEKEWRHIELDQEGSIKLSLSFRDAASGEQHTLQNGEVSVYQVARAAADDEGYYFDIEQGQFADKIKEIVRSDA